MLVSPQQSSRMSPSCWKLRLDFAGLSERMCAPWRTTTNSTKSRWR